MSKFTAFTALILTLAAASPALAQCTGTSLCCQSLEPFSDNAYVWQNICGIQESDQSILVGSFCEEVPSGTWYDGPSSVVYNIFLTLLSSPSGTIDVCCQSAVSECQSTSYLGNKA